MMERKMPIMASGLTNLKNDIFCEDEAHFLPDSGRNLPIRDPGP